MTTFKILILLALSSLLSACGGDPPSQPSEPLGDSIPSSTIFTVPEDSEDIVFTISNYGSSSSVYLQGAHAGLFTIQTAPVIGEPNVVTATITPMTQFDYEATGGSLDLTLIIKTNPIVLSTHTLSVEVVDVIQEAPKFTFSQVSRVENTTSAIEIIAQDDNNDNFDLTLSTEYDYQFFNLTGSSLTFVNPPNFEDKTTYYVRVNAVETTTQLGAIINPPKSSSQIITVNITDVNDPAIITIPPTFITDLEGNKTFSATNADDDDDNNVFIPTPSTATASGTYSIASDGLIQYTMSPSTILSLAPQLPPFQITDTIPVQSQDGTTVNHQISLLATNHPHQLNPDTYGISYVDSQVYVFDVLSNDTDVDSPGFSTNGTLSASSANSTITITDQKINYQPYTPPSYPFTDIITYTLVNDGVSVSTTVTVNISSDYSALLDDITLPASTVTINPPGASATRGTWHQINLPSSVGGEPIVWSTNNQQISFLSPTSFIPAHPPVSSSDLSATITATITDPNNSQHTKDFPITVKNKNPIASPKQLVIRVDFLNSQFNEAAGSTSQFVKDLMFKPGSSSRDFFLENSFDYIDIQPAVLPSSGYPASITDADPLDGVVTYRHSEDATATTGSLGGKYPNGSILGGALAAVNSYVDFAPFDTNNNGVLESIELNIVFVFATCSRAFTGYGGCECPTYTEGICYNGANVSAAGIHPASAQIQAMTMDGKTLGGSASSRLTWIGDHMLSGSNYVFLPYFNILSHEIGHNMWNIGDLYGTPDQYSIKSWGLMGSSHLKIADIYNPQHMTAYNKVKLGFVDPIISTPYSRSVSGVGENRDLTSFASDNPNPILITNQSTIANIFSNQYLITEVRDVTQGYDRGLDDISGASTVAPTDILITHYTPGKYGNSSASIYRDMELSVRNRNASNVADNWPDVMFGTSHTMTETTSPNTNFHTNSSDFSQNSGINIDSINKTGDTYTILLNN